MNHTVYMEGGSIINATTGGIIERPSVLVSVNEDMIHGWGDYDNVYPRFEKYVEAYRSIGDEEAVKDLLFIELSEYKIPREAACYVIRRMSEHTATGFVKNFCEALKSPDPMGWLKGEMERIPLDINEKEWHSPGPKHLI